MKILFVLGTRPEAIKLAPVIMQASSMPHVEADVCVTGQHADIVLNFFHLLNIKVKFDLQIMSHNQSLTHITTKVLEGVHKIIEGNKYDVIIVHGDTTSAFAACVAAFYSHIPVAHVEAGLRTWNMQAPWPEEMNRVLIDRMASLYFAPTQLSKENLSKEGAKQNHIYVTGNTVVDTLKIASDLLNVNSELQSAMVRKFDFIDETKKMILVTAHRRENFGSPLKNIFKAIRTIAESYDVQVVYPVHPNPRVKDVACNMLQGIKNIDLIQPQEYFEFVYLMKQSYIILTDSGGIQEEAPSLGKPVLVLRDVTERPEAAESGGVVVVGTESAAIESKVAELLFSSEKYHAMTHVCNPFGDGFASRRIMDAILHEFAGSNLV